ncbi:MAG: SAM-dependent methyltransferase [Pirellulaceae bacterium]|nr:MAG: SAM-dependent methyltransferase [Pirellulaceae bacterium]
MSPLPRDPASGPTPSGKVRIVGGRFRGRLIPYRVDRRTRPMKDRVREALFSILGDTIRQLEVIDLFAGTGALGLEALSRGARRAVFVERHIPTAQALEKILRDWHIEQQAELVRADAFFWLREDWQPSPRPVLLFFSPPYALYYERTEETVGLIEHFFRRAAPGSWAIVESDTGFDIARHLPDIHWTVRDYPPVRLAFGQKAGPAGVGDGQADH